MDAAENRDAHLALSGTGGIVIFGLMQSGDQMKHPELLTSVVMFRAKALGIFSQRLFIIGGKAYIKELHNELKRRGIEIRWSGSTVLEFRGWTMGTRVG